MVEHKQPNRWRCLKAGCNPILDADSAQAHHEQTAHRVAKWPVRSAEGERRARLRNRSGYYDKYNVGDKSPDARFGRLRDSDLSDPMRGISYAEAHPEEWK